MYIPLATLVVATCERNSDSPRRMQAELDLHFKSVFVCVV